MQLLVKNIVTDYGRWRQAFDADLERAQSFGLSVYAIWQAKDNPETVYFVLNVDSEAAARAFMNTPESAAVGERAGVLDGDFHFLRPAPDC